MTWTVEHLRSLNKVVTDKYNSEFDTKWPSDWMKYLEKNGIMLRRATEGRPPELQGRLVFIECPLSVQNSIPGVRHTKWSIYFPEELAERIITLQYMP
jgi:hypothetical protein